jgi:ATP-dependent 26S proteasome regulatory subunit
MNGKQIQKELEEGNISPTLKQICSLIRTNPVVWVTTFEEHRFAAELYASPLCDGDGRWQLWSWSTCHGLVPWAEEQEGSLSEPLKNSKHPGKVLDCIKQLRSAEGSRLDNADPDRPIIVLLKDFHAVLTPPIPRQIRDLRFFLQTRRIHLVMLSPYIAHGPSGSQPGMEPTLKRTIRTADFSLPSRDEIRSHIGVMLGNLESQKKESENPEQYSERTSYTGKEMESIVSSLQGLSVQEMGPTLVGSFMELGELDPQHLLQQKRDLIAQSEILEYVKHTPSFDEVGGLDQAKQFFARYDNQHTTEAKEFGVEPLRGVLLLGVPGTGKSLLAKAVGERWKLPLLRLDLGRAMTGILGGSEALIRNGIKQAEAMAPCILWLDEVEKAISGSRSSGMTDGGTFSRVFSTILVAMQEGLAGVTILATANEIAMLPPEFIRRFDEVFFVDLPSFEEKRQVFRIHLRKRGRNPEDFDIDTLETEAWRFTPAEIEKAIKQAIATSFREGKKELTTECIKTAIREIKPIAETMAESIEASRKWADGRAKRASSPVKPRTQKKSTPSPLVVDLSKN